MGHVSHHKKRSLTKAAAQIVLVLGALAFASSALHFAYTAYESSDCYNATKTDPFSGEPVRRSPVDSDECRLVLATSEQHQRFDAAIAVLAIVVGTGAAVRLSNSRRRTKRVVLVVELAVVAVGTIYILLLASVLR